MNKIQWYIFSGGFFILSFILQRISISKNLMATAMIGIDSSAFAAWKIISGVSFLFGTISIVLAMIFLWCALAEPKWIK